MKVVAVIGSPRGMGGNTGRLLQAALEGARQAGAAAQAFPLSELQVQPCTGCGACHRTGICPTEDDFQGIADAAAGADGIVLASPNYTFNVSAQVKAFLDRCCGSLHCQTWDGKHGAAVVTSGGSGGEEVQAYLLRFLRGMGCWTVGSVGAESRQLADATAAAEVLQDARGLGGRLAEAARIKLTVPGQADERRAFAERMRHLVTSMKDVWPYEYEYWRARGRL